MLKYYFVSLDGIGCESFEEAACGIFVVRFVVAFRLCLEFLAVESFDSVMIRVV